MSILKKYATAATVHVPMISFGLNDFNSSWVPAAGDVKIGIDGGTLANIGTLPSYANGVWTFTLTTGEMTGKEINVFIIDSATKVVEDNCIQIRTYGHASADIVFDLSTASTAQTGDSFARIGSAGAGLTALGDTRIANLDAAISTRSTYAGGDTSGTTTLLTRLSSGRASNLDNLDAAITTRSDYDPSTDEVLVDMSQPVPVNGDDDTLGRCLEGAQAQAFNRWLLDELSLKIFGTDAVTVLKDFTLDAETNTHERS